ncbi:hypothetical protein ACFSUJ_21035 [Streptomyces lusitanus]|uniref:Secreted protein n=1 Tax=Streptomyces lusitanus TaxID=68232 RepID=A0ABU3JSF3_9ACTN|nr:hypothetical protein [Streptomyces lusitanus]
MPDPRRRKHRTWFIAWAVLCAAGFAATEALTRSPPADEPSVSTDCADYIAQVEARLAEQWTDAEGTVVAVAGISNGTDHDCSQELREHFDAD